MRALRGTSHGFALGLGLLAAAYVAAVFRVHLAPYQSLSILAELGGIGFFAAFCGGWVGWEAASNIEHPLGRVLFVTGVATVVASLASVLGVALTLSGLGFLALFWPPFYFVFVFPGALITLAWATLFLRYARPQTV